MRDVEDSALMQRQSMLRRFDLTMSRLSFELWVNMGLMLLCLEMCQREPEVRSTWEARTEQDAVNVCSHKKYSEPS